MTQDKYTRPDNTSQSASAYKANIDNGFETYERASGSLFQGHEQSSPDMTVRLEAGVLWDGPGNAPVDVAAQSTGTITAPSTNPRIDRVVVDTSGTVSVITGTEDASPTAPAVTAGKITICQVALATSTTSITNSLITDERPSYIGNPAAGIAGISNVVEDTTPQLGGDLDLNGNDIVDTNGNEVITHTATTSAVNHVNFINADSGNMPVIQAAGDDTNVDLRLKGQGTGTIKLGDGELQFPDADGSADQVIKTNGSGVLSFVTAAGGAWEYISGTVVSSDASIDFTGLAAGYDYHVVCTNLVPATDGTDIDVVIGTGATPTYKTGASDYGWAALGYYAGSFAGAYDEADARIELTPAGSSNVSTEGGTYEITIHDPGNASEYTKFSFQSSYVTATPWHATAVGSATYFSNTAVTAVRIKAASGNLSTGTIRLYRRQLS